MKAVCWMGTEKMTVENVPDPEILNPRDAIVKITSTCICGSDLHLYNGYMPTMEQGDIMGTTRHADSRTMRYTGNALEEHHEDRQNPP
jgi:threonine dehydrogenase-like Zn-dependent dehydrogenase